MKRRKEHGKEPHHRTPEIVRTIFDMSRDGMSLRAIARALNGRGVPTARGGKWYAGTVGYMLSNGLYKGVYGYKGEMASREDLAIT